MLLEKPNRPVLPNDTQAQILANAVIDSQQPAKLHRRISSESQGSWFQDRR